MQHLVFQANMLNPSVDQFLLESNHNHITITEQLKSKISTFKILLSIRSDGQSTADVVVKSKLKWQVSAQHLAASLIL